tara:strand:- start:710 stop:1612 length:903 start_codon:yes stop_codon:yes gene_type:complete
VSDNHHHPDLAGRRLWLAVFVNIVLTLAQIVGGIIAGSLALIADALHNFSDAGSLLLALLARRIARRSADEVMTFGYGRAEVIAALINFTTLIVIGIYLIYEAVARAIDPQPIAGWIVVVVATVALVIDLVTAWLTYALSKGSMNIRAAFVHNISDALASIGVIIAGTLVILFGWRLADPIVTLLIAGYVLYHGVSEIGSAIRILMSGAPAGMNINEVDRALQGVDGVLSVHHVHLWAIDEHRRSLEAHVVTDMTSPVDAEILKVTLKKLVRQRFDITHTTLELEYLDAAASCDDKEHCA